MLKTVRTCTGAILLIALISSCNSNANKQQEPQLMKITAYPETRKEEKTLDFFGTAVSDPYLWLENDTSAETGVWVKAQNQVSRNYLDSIPFRKKIVVEDKVVSSPAKDFGCIIQIRKAGSGAFNNLIRGVLRIDGDILHKAEYSKPIFPA